MDLVEHFYTEADRRVQLRALEQALEQFLDVLRSTPELRAPIRDYEENLGEVRRLLAEGFNQDALSALSRAVPRLFWLHKEWIPPLPKPVSTPIQSGQALFGIMLLVTKWDWSMIAYGFMGLCPCVDANTGTIP